MRAPESPPPPPPDPREDARADPPWLELAAPTTWVPRGPPTLEAERLAGLILAHRPGALLVFDTR